MKQLRRRRHLRPRPTRSMVNQQIQRVRSALQPFQLEWLLAKRELLRNRHPVTLGMLVSDEKLGRRFMAKFILKREDPHVLAKEFQSLDIIQSDREEKLKAALMLDDLDEPAEEVTVIKPSAELRPETAKPQIRGADCSFDAPAAHLPPSTGQGSNRR